MQKHTSLSIYNIIINDFKEKLVRHHPPSLRIKKVSGVKIEILIKYT